MLACPREVEVALNRQFDSEITQDGPRSRTVNLETALGLNDELDLADRGVGVERERDVDVHDVAKRRAHVAQA